MNQHHLHQTYIVLSHHENYSMIEHRSQHTKHRCFVLPVAENEEIILYHQGMRWDGEPQFQISILNYYQANHTYTFELVREQEKALVITSNHHLMLGAPLAIKEDPFQTEFTLKVNDLDLDQNRLLFAMDHLVKAIDYSVFEKEHIYHLPVHSVFTKKNGNHYLLVRYQNQDFEVALPEGFPAVAVGTEVPVVYKTKKGKSYLNLIKSYIIQHSYEVKKAYPFLLMEKKVDENSGLMRWVLKDHYGFIHFYQPDCDVHFPIAFDQTKIGDTVELYVIRMINEGYLQLRSQLTDWSEKSYDVKDVFASIGMPEAVMSHFYHQENQIQDYLANQRLEFNYLEQHELKENIWVFSFINYLDLEIHRMLSKEEIEEAQTRIQLLIRLEEWVLGGSDYLTVFSPFKQQNIISKAERKLEQVRGMQEAIALFTAGEAIPYLEKIHSQLGLSGYLSVRQVHQLKSMLQCSSYGYFSMNNEMILTCIEIGFKKKLFSESDLWSIQLSLGKILKEFSSLLKDSMDENHHWKGNASIQTAIHAAYVLLKISYPTLTVNARVHQSVRLLRFFHLYHDEKVYLDCAMDMLIRQCYLVPDNHSSVFDLTVDDIRLSLSEPMQASYQWSNAGKVYLADQQLYVVPKNLMHRNFHQVENSLINYHGLHVVSYPEIAPINLSAETTDLIHQVLDIIYYKHNEPVQQDTPFHDIPRDLFYEGKVKSNFANSHCFLRVEEEEVRFESLLHYSVLHGSRVFERVSDYLQPSDVIRFKIDHIKGQKVHITPEPLLNAFAEKVLVQPIKTTAVLVRQYENRLFFVTKEGYPVVHFTNTPHAFTVQSYYEMTLIKYNAPYHFFEVSAESIHQIGEDLAIDARSAYRSYLMAADVLVEEGVSTEEELERPMDQRIHTTCFTLFHVMQARLRYLDDVHELIVNYFLLATITSYLKIGKSFEFVGKLEALKASFQHDVQPSTLDKNEELTAHELLSYLDSEVTQLPGQHAPDSPLFALKKLIEAHNLIQKLDPAHPHEGYLKQLIQEQMLQFDGDDLALNLRLKERQSVMKIAPVTNLGMESKSQEFKSSFYYSASEEKQADVIMRTINGFLNSYEGGQLYIGVNDKGDIIGLEKDFQFHGIRRSKDQYLSDILRSIDYTFPKMISTLYLDFKFHQVNQRDYLEISIKPFDQPIPLQKKFYQRQGNRTVLLEGSDLLDFFHYKSSGTVPMKSTGTLGMMSL